MPQSQTAYASPVEQAIDSFRAIFKAKLKEAFTDWPFNALERWEIIVRETNRAYEVLSQVLNLSPYDMDCLMEILLDTCDANEKRGKDEVQESIDRYLNVFERKATS